MPTLLYINDNNLLIQQNGQFHRSQGYAWMKGEDVFFDNDAQNSAVKNCRRSPQEINNRYWQQCEQSAISSNAAGMRHSADLIWRHLSELKELHSLQELVLVVPSHYQASNLQLLLGIAKSCGLEVVGLVNKSVLALHDKVVGDGEYLHLDIQLHQSVSTVVTVQAGRAQLGSVEIIQNVGIYAMQDALLKSIQHSFIQNDRFDPLHYAITEQQLFDQLSVVANEIEKVGKSNVNVEHERRVHSTSVDKKQWNSVITPLLKRLIANASATNSKAVYVDANAAFAIGDISQSRGVGLTDLQSAGMMMLQPVSSVDSKLLISNTNTPGIVDYLTDLPVSETQNATNKETQSAMTPAVATSATASIQASNGALIDGHASHLLQAGVALPIENSELRADGGQLTLHKANVGNVQAMLNDQKIFVLNDSDRRELQANDRLGSNLADGVVTVISVTH